ncbi:MAG TPA: sugar-transfer associated ATP-grasp domain-containing protein [Terriglobia bacterium]|nr:sugar-transfer associated ATP-grasp domain-containing protein [Terriglobia bacterium]
METNTISPAIDQAATGQSAGTAGRAGNPPDDKSAIRRHGEPLGHQARRIFDRFIRHRRRSPDRQFLYWPGMPAVLETARWLYWWGLTSGRIASEEGVSRWRQLREAWRFTWREGMQAQLYYMFELYRPAEQARVGAYLSRRETKNGLIRALNHIVRKGRGRQTDFGDKAGFIRLLQRHGLPVTPLLMTCEAGTATPATLDPAASGGDLFIKDRYGKGAQGAMAIPRLASGRLDYRGRALTLAELIATLTRRSKKVALIVVPRLHNHPNIADLAEQSLITLRVFTCLDEKGVPTIAMAMLRILGKLEPRWRMKTEWGAAIDLDSGRLGDLVSDQPHLFNGRYRNHPVNGRPVAGRAVPLWQEVRDIALAGHRLAADRLLIGWDIAVTPAGPVILEANGLPDFLFPQRVHRLPVGQTPFGDMLQHHLDRLEREIDRLPPEQRRIPPAAPLTPSAAAIRTASPPPR